VKEELKATFETNVEVVKSSIAYLMLKILCP